MSHISKVRLRNFTAFDELDAEFAPGINILTGANGTGKTHLMKALYAACDITRGQVTNYADKLVRTFLPTGRKLGRLVKRQRGRATCTAEIHRGQSSLAVRFSTKDNVETAQIKDGGWSSKKLQSVYIPVKEILANAPGFISLYNERSVHFEEVYADLLHRAYTPPPRGPYEGVRKKMLKILRGHISGSVITTDETFYLKNQQGELEFTLLAEGMRKLGLLWLLIQNGTLLRGSVMFWDEPEANLNPKMLRPLADVLLALQREGVQLFLATHSYELLKELYLQRQHEDSVVCHALYQADDGRIAHQTAQHFTSVHPNAIMDAWEDLYERDLQQSIKDLIDG